MNAWTIYESPLGPLILCGGAQGLTALHFPGHAGRLDEDAHDPRPLAEAVGQLEQYFAGERHAFELALDLGGTPFQRAVWDALREIPAGEVRSYGALAARLGRAGAARAVGGACARNPVAVLVPCHRAVASTGALTGFAFGLDRKRWLLAHEAGEAGAPRTPVSARTARARP
jgi:methylated-DNA-[protein]-cysteine S-methyltransferase